MKVMLVIADDVPYLLVLAFHSMEIDRYPFLGISAEVCVCLMACHMVQE